MPSRKLLARMAAAAAGAFLAFGPVSGEVSVNLGPDGAFRYTSYLVTGTPEAPAFWKPVRDVEATRILNPEGDSFRDGRPAFLTDPQTGHPVVVWSRPVGRSTVLVWSTWEGDGWSPPRWLHNLSAAAADRQPVILVDRNGKSLLLWWRDEDGNGRIFWSRWETAGRWTEPKATSPAAAENRFPGFDVDAAWPDASFPGRGHRKSGAPTPDGHYPLHESSQLQPDGITDDPDILP